MIARSALKNYHPHSQKLYGVKTVSPIKQNKEIYLGRILVDTAIEALLLLRIQMIFVVMQKGGKMKETIYKEDAIDAIVKCTNCNTPEDLREYVAEHSLLSQWSGGVLEALEAVEGLPSAPLYTPDEIQTMQDLESAQMEKMYELGKEEAMQRTQMSLTEPCEHCQEFDCYGCQFRPIIREKVMPNE